MEFITSDFLAVTDKLTSFALLVLFVIALSRGWIVTKREHALVEKRCEIQEQTIKLLVNQNNQLLIGAKVSAEVLKILPQAIGEGMSDVH